MIFTLPSKLRGIGRGVYSNIAKSSCSNFYEN